MQSLVDSLAAMAALFPYFAAALALFFLGKILFDLSTPGIEDDRELTERDNPAFGALFVGYMLGLAIALASAFSGLGPSVAGNLLDIGVSGLSATVLLRLSMLVGGRLILPSFRLDKEIVADRNLGAGFAYAGLLVASGLVLAGVMSGRSDSWLLMLRDIAVYWAVGQAFLVASGWIFRLIARYDLGAAIGEGNNVAAGLSLGGWFVAMGIVLRAALTNAGSDLGPELLVTLVVGAAGLVLLVLARFIVSLVLLPGANLADEVSRQGNTAAGAVSALGYVAVALLFGALAASQLQQ